MSCHQGGCIIISKTVFILPFNALEADCMFYSDKPIGSNNEDMLNRKGFAKILARTLVHLESRDTFTVGLFGKWGSGKTSLVNMTLTEIESIQAERKTEDQIIVVHFEPWNFTDTNQLLTQFFIRLANEFQNKEDRTLTKIGKALEKYSDCKNQKTTNTIRATAMIFSTRRVRWFLMASCVLMRDSSFANRFGSSSFSTWVPRSSLTVVSRMTAIFINCSESGTDIPFSHFEMVCLTT